ncbi:MAG: histidine phosphotransferase family protein [Sneathiellaceae bacterium]
MTSLKLAGLMCSRLCHDLAGPIGALQNGIELMAEDDDPDLQAQALDLVALASSQAGRKLRFYRLVFGAGLAGGEDLAVAECRGALEGLLDGGRIQVAWTVPDGGWPRPLGRLLLALALIASQGMPRGGRLEVAPSGSAAPELAGGLSIACDGTGAALDGGLVGFLSGSRLLDEAATPGDAVACLAHELSQEVARPVAVDQAADRFSLRI